MSHIRRPGIVDVYTYLRRIGLVVVFQLLSKENFLHDIRALRSNGEIVKLAIWVLWDASSVRQVMRCFISAKLSPTHAVPVSTTTAACRLHAVHTSNRKSQVRSMSEACVGLDCC